jgi:hypothetical protein
METIAVILCGKSLYDLCGRILLLLHGRVCGIVAPLRGFYLRMFSLIVFLAKI